MSEAFATFLGHISEWFGQFNVLGFSDLIMDLVQKLFDTIEGWF